MLAITITPMSSADAAAFRVSQPPRAKTLALAALAALVCGLACLALAASVAIGFARSAALERAEEGEWLLVRGTIVGERVAYPMVPATSGFGVTFQLRPQIEVQYTVGGQELRTWVDVPAPGQLDSQNPGDYNVAHSALARYHRGEWDDYYCDPADATSLRLAYTDGGRRTLLAGSILAGLASVPGIGLVIASWLLWRAGRQQRPPGAAP